jgi:hypothetical protein
LFARVGPKSRFAIQVVITIYNEETGMLKHNRRGHGQAGSKTRVRVKIVTWD